MALNLSAILNLNGNFVQGMQKAAQTTSQMQQKVSAFASNSKAAFGAVGLIAAGYLTSAVNSAAKAQESTERLKKLVENQGISWDKASGQVGNFTSGIMKMSAFSAGDAKAALTNLTTKGVKFNDSLKMQGTLMDLAAGNNMDLTTASNLLGQAYNGRYGQLVKLGIVTKEQVKHGLNFAQVQDAINKRFGGAAKGELNTYEGQMKQLNNTMTSFKTTIGTYILPYVQKFATFANDLAQKLNNLSPSTKKTIAVILGLVAGLGTLIGGGAAIGKIFGALSPVFEGIAGVIGGLSLPIVLIVGAIALLAVAFTKNWGGIRTKTMQFIAWIKPILINGIKEIIKWVKTNLPIIEADFKKVLANVKKIFNTYVKPVVDFFIQQVGQIVSWVKQNWPLIQSTIKIVLDNIKKGITKVLNFITGFWNKHGETIKKIVALIWDNIKTSISTIIHVIEDIISIVMDIINGKWGDAWNKLVDAVKSIFGGVGKIIKNVIKGVGIIFTDLAKTALSWGEDFIDGLIKGIKNKISDIGNAAKSVGDTIKKFLHFSVPDAGPLTDYMSWMPDMMQGFSKGIKLNTHLVTEPIKDVALGIKTNMQSGTQGTGTNSTVSKGTINSKPFVINMYGATITKPQDIDSLATAIANKLMKTSNGMV